MRSTLLIASLVAMPTLLSAQQTLLRLAPPQGQVSRYRIETETSVNMTQMSMDASAILQMTATVTGANGEERTLHTVVDSFRVDAPGMPMGALPDLVGSSTTIRMTTRGQVLETTYSNDALTQAFGGLAGPSGNSFPSGMTLPDAPVAVGHQWSDSSVVDTDGGQMGGVRVRTRANYTFERLESRGGTRIAVIGITGTITQSNAMMTSEGSMRGSMEFDLDAGRWVLNQMQVEMQMEAGGQDATLTIRTRGRLVS